MPEKILIVDDDIDSLKLIGLMLQRTGYEVVAASTGAQALSKAFAESPDLIILDVMMPDMNGYDVCRKLRAHAQTKATPIIMFTAKTMIDDKVAGFEAGADDYLTKPTHPAELASRVKTILARNQPAGVKTSAPTPPPQVIKHLAHKALSIGVIGAKGGVGTTTLALNIAVALLQNENHVIVSDFRPGSGSLGTYLGFPRSVGWANLFTRPAAEIKAETVEKELELHSSGLRALLSSSRPKEAQFNIALDSVMAVTQQLQSQSRVVVMDLGSTYTNAISRLQREMDQLVLVVEPNAIALKLGQDLLHELQGNGDGSHIHIVVVNRLQSALQTPWHEVEHILGKEIRAIISPAADLAFQAAEAQVPIILYQPNAAISGQFVKLADELQASAKTIVSGLTT